MDLGKRNINFHSVFHTPFEMNSSLWPNKISISHSNFPALPPDERRSIMWAISEIRKVDGVYFQLFHYWFNPSIRLCSVSRCWIETKPGSQKKRWMLPCSMRNLVPISFPFRLSLSPTKTSINQSELWTQLESRCRTPIWMIYTSHKVQLPIEEI